MHYRILNGDSLVLGFAQYYPLAYNPHPKCALIRPYLLLIWRGGCMARDHSWLYERRAAQAAQGYSRVVILDADTLMLRRADELFSMGPLPFAASLELHRTWPNC